MPAFKSVGILELARELGTSTEVVLDLCDRLGVPARNGRSTINLAYADMVRRRAQRDLDLSGGPLSAPPRRGRSARRNSSAGRPFMVRDIAAQAGVSNGIAMRACLRLGLEVLSESSPIADREAAALALLLEQVGTARVAPIRTQMPMMIRELGRSWNVPSKQLLQGCRVLGIHAYSSSSSVDPHDVRRLQRWQDEVFISRALDGVEPIRGGRAAGGSDAAPSEPEVPSELEQRAEPSAFDAWWKRGRIWIESSNAAAARFESFFERLFANGLQWADEDIVLFEARPWDEWPDDAWLEEILARADSLQPSLTLAPDFPVTFDDGQYAIHLDVRGGTACAWVGTRGRGLLVTFSVIRYDTWFREADPDARYAVGLAISWFLDCCVGLRSERQHPHLTRAERSSAVGGRAWPGSSYIPTPAFAAYVRSVGWGHSAPPVAHRVKGHRRRLPVGWEPTHEARSAAPAHVRLTMGDRDTFVRSHQRGQGEARQRMFDHLSTHSCLADALGGLRAATR